MLAADLIRPWTFVVPPSEALPSVPRMNAFDSFSLLSKLLPRVTAIAFVLCVFLAPGPTNAAIMNAIEEKAATLQSRFERALEPALNPSSPDVPAPKHAPLAHR